MRKICAKIFLLCILFINLLPMTALAADGSAPPEKPYEKVVAKSGSWYAEQLSLDGKTNLVIGYNGD
ncbi:hypothetical protein [Syntrophomonas wolfei]|uniref:hypothetical protein n=1 Tax=Syntrophomonas wolfei TaxID=863 RepID=UPI0023F37287|nr:hypothetical protein [Syntrophomonas wolfei]